MSKTGTFIVRQDFQYDAFVDRYQAKSLITGIVYLLLHVLPGILAFLLINVALIHDAALRLTGLSDTLFQGLCLVGVTVVWHAFLPFIVLRWADKLTIRQSIAFLGLNRFDVKGFFLVVPVAFVAYTIVSLPFMKYAYADIGQWVNHLPGLAIPAYSIFQGNKIYALPPVMLGLLAFGNFVGEEIYFRGYLLKKIGFLGSWAWVVNSVLFALYHLWQANMTWPLAGLSLAFGLLMQWRKNLYPLILFHFMANIVWGALIGIALSHWP